MRGWIYTFFIPNGGCYLRNIKCKHINNALMEEIDNSVIRIFRVTDRDEKFMMKNILPK